MGELAATETVLSEFAAAVAARTDAAAIRWRRRGGDWETATWGDYGRRAAGVAGGLGRLGIEPGDRVALLMRNRPEFHFADIGVLLGGGVPVSIYNSTPPDQLRQLLTHCRARIVIADDSELLERVLAVRDGLRDLRHVVVVDDREHLAPADVSSFEDLAAGRPVDMGAACARAAPDAPATVIYTSGTTGPPKGVVITHANVVATADAIRRAVGRSRADLAGQRVVSYLPMAHIAERMISHYEGIGCGLEVTTCPEVGLIGRYLPDVRPHIAFGVPRIWERVHARVSELFAGPGASTEAEAVRRILGLDAAELVFTGSAPTSPALIEWFRSMAIPMAEIYGLSETTGAVATETVHPRAGWAGRPLPGVEVRLARDGEILVRGPNVFAGYLDDPAATEEVIDADGWFHTGDVGEVDGDRYIRVVDRKKELIVTAGGKKVSPAYLETALKALPLVAHAAVVGEGRPSLIALVVVDAEAATSAGLSTRERDAEIARGIAAVNAGVAPHERIRRWAVLDREWTPASGELTPTMKLKRREIEAKYAAEIAALYQPNLRQ